MKQSIITAITHRAGEHGDQCSDCGVKFRERWPHDTDVAIIETPHTYVEYAPGEHDNNEPCRP